MCLQRCRVENGDCKCPISLPLSGVPVDQKTGLQVAHPNYSAEPRDALSWGLWGKLSDQCYSVAVRGQFRVHLPVCRSSRARRVDLGGSSHLVLGTPPDPSGLEIDRIRWREPVRAFAALVESLKIARSRRRPRVGCSHFLWSRTLGPACLSQSCLKSIPPMEGGGLHAQGFRCFSRVPARRFQSARHREVVLPIVHAPPEVKSPDTLNP